MDVVVDVVGGILDQHIPCAGQDAEVQTDIADINVALLQQSTNDNPAEVRDLVCQLECACLSCYVVHLMHEHSLCFAGV